MIRLNMHEAKIRGLPRTPKGRRPFGLAKGEFRVPSAFFEPLPEEILDAFEGGSGCSCPMSRLARVIDDFLARRRLPGVTRY